MLRIILLTHNKLVCSTFFAVCFLRPFLFLGVFQLYRGSREPMQINAYIVTRRIIIARTLSCSINADIEITVRKLASIFLRLALANKRPRSATQRLIYLILFRLYDSCMLNVFRCTRTYLKYKAGRNFVQECKKKERCFLI